MHKYKQYYIQNAVHVIASLYEAREILWKRLYKLKLILRLNFRSGQSNFTPIAFSKVQEGQSRIPKII